MAYMTKQNLKEIRVNLFYFLYVTKFDIWI